LNILLVSPGFPPDGVGGIENIVKMLYDAYEKDGHSVHVLTRYRHTQVSDPRVLQVKTGQGEIRGYGQWAANAWIKAQGLDYDVIHLHGFEGQVLSLLPWLHAPRIVQVHNALTREPEWYLRQAVRHKFGHSIASRSFLAAEQVVAPTAAAKGDIIQNLRKIDPRKIRVIPNCIDSSAYSPEEVKSDVREKYSLGGKFVILYFGKIKRTKGVEDICKAYDILKKKIDAALIIGGAAKNADTFTRYLKNTYRDVIFTGYVEDPRPYYSAADVFSVYTTGFEGGEVSSVALLEAMSMGLPVVCSDNPIFREITREAALYARPGDPGTLAAVLHELAKSPSKAKELGKMNRSLVQSLYDTRRVSAQMEELYRELAS
jgi:glycosyltransferase involved in cell wall biosynthesis